MKSTISLSVALLGSSVLAYPNAMNAARRSPEYAASSAFNPEDLEKRQLGQNVGFNPELQFVSNQGQHRFVPPGPNDIRGPCPGLNAAANHNYLPHNGVATIQQFIDGTFTVFGMGKDLGGFLAIYGAIFDGDLLSWSIGGPPPASLVSPLAGLVGQPQGLSGSHNKYENDVSPTRGDLYEVGDASTIRLEQFKELYSYQETVPEETSNYDLGVLTTHRVKRFKHSVENNPYFVNNFFSGLEVQPAAFTFIYRFMSNKSEEFPAGRLSKNVLKAFFGIYGDTPDTFEARQGWEYIPDNWYKRAIGDEYTIPFFEVDLLAAAAQFPQFLSIGGNTGEVNTFTGVDITNITGGVYNTRTLAEGHNAMCLAYQLIFLQSPDILKGSLINVGKATSMISQQLGSLISSFGCPELGNRDKQSFNQAMSKFPGVTELQKDGTYRMTKM